MNTNNTYDIPIQLPGHLPRSRGKLWKPSSETVFKIINSWVNIWKYIHPYHYVINTGRHSVDMVWAMCIGFNVYTHNYALVFVIIPANIFALRRLYTVYSKKYAHGFVVLCFVVVMQSFIMNSHEVFIHIHQGCFAGTGAIVRLPQCQWSKPDGYGKISQCITTTKHSKAKTVCIFLGIYCMAWTWLPATLGYDVKRITE